MTHHCPVCPKWFRKGERLIDHLGIDHGWSKKQRLVFVEKLLDSLSHSSVTRTKEK